MQKTLDKSELSEYNEVVQENYRLISEICQVIFEKKEDQMKEKIKAATEFLSQYNKIQKSRQIIDEQMFKIAALLRELIREEQGASENALRRAEEYKSKLYDELADLKMRRNALCLRQTLIENVVNSLNKQEAQIIKRFYFSENTHRASDDLMESLGFEKTHIYRLKSRALSKISDIIDEVDSIGPLRKETREQT